MGNQETSTGQLHVVPYTRSRNTSWLGVAMNGGTLCLVDGVDTRGHVSSVYTLVGCLRLLCTPSSSHVCVR